MLPNLHALPCLRVGGTKVETRLSLRHEVDSGIRLGVGDNSRSDGSGPELALLRAAPPVGMGQHELNLMRHRIPTALPVWIGGNEEHPCRIEEIAHEIGEDVDDCLSLRELFAHLFLQCCRRLRRSQHQLPPVDVSAGGGEWMRSTNQRI